MIRGLVIPALFVASGLYILATGEGFIVGRMGVMRVFGGAVTALAISWFGLAAICHFRWFWRDRRILWRMAALGQVAGLMVWLISWLYVIGSVLRRL
jgi:NADH:ubiquinone oxidoreductase subunit 5 (subunit L)/multisubunit Na+/H+ antiporter MnhA subunit